MSNVRNDAAGSGPSHLLHLQWVAEMWSLWLFKDIIVLSHTSTHLVSLECMDSNLAEYLILK
jgi:hypothetical protein